MKNDENMQTVVIYTSHFVTGICQLGVLKIALLLVTTLCNFSSGVLYSCVTMLFDIFSLVFYS
jgi:hypothetical protein